MRYQESKDRSAEVLRLALAQMGRQAAAFNPVTFTIWYEYAAGINPKLHAAMEQLLQDKQEVDDAIAARLYMEYIAATDEAAMRRIGGEFQRMLGGIAQSASATGERAGRYTEQLETLTAALLSDDVAQITPRIDEARVGTEEMKHSAQALQQQVISSQHEITQLRNDLDRARGEALTDPLTGLLNRKGFDQRLKALFDEPAAAGREHCLVMLDIDHFKTVNDAHGHVMGDRVIQGLGEILRRAVGDGPYSAARYGGEEFALVMPHCTLDDALALAEQTRNRAKTMKIRNRNTQEVMFTITISGGVAALRPGDDAATFVARADAALYRSKQDGRDRVCSA